MVAQLKARSKGLLERRGSSAVLTIDLTNGSTLDNNVPDLSPIKESFALENNENKKERFLSRHELRRLNIRENLAEIFAEFAVLPSPNDAFCQKVVGCSQKNRHMVWPISRTRVNLVNSNSTLICGSKFALTQSVDEANCYINANYITDFDLSSSYIATEGPMCNTINNFWSMVWQEKSIAIVMITKLEEQVSKNGKYKRLCEKYWPDEKAVYGNIEVEIIGKNSYEGIIIQELVLRCNEEEHKMRHYWFTEWHDHRLPIGRTNDVLKLIMELKAYRDHRRRESDTISPVTVHCSAGIGRTCTFIAVALGVEQLRRTNSGVDIYSIVSKLRMERYGAVQHPEQYAFIYLALQRMENLLSTSKCEENETLSPSIIEPEFLNENFYDEENSTHLHNTSDLINLHHLYSQKRID